MVWWYVEFRVAEASFMVLCNFLYCGRNVFGNVTTYCIKEISTNVSTNVSTDVSTNMST